MRIHKLEVQAFGPFADRQVVDFDDLAAHGIFLLHGPTGAGKTSVLDAVCFSLYGDVPGARQGSKALRSDHAAADMPPEVVCEFSTGGRRFEVTRSPKWERPSRRGSGGTSTQQAQTLLREKVGDTWVEKTTRNDEAAMEITGVLGMNREQFTKVVMLPQGDFAAFLKSPASERQALLQQLFGTERFGEIEDALSSESTRARMVLTEAETRLERLRQRIIDDAEHLAGITGEVSEEWPGPADTQLISGFRSRLEARLGANELALASVEEQAVAVKRERDLLVERRSRALKLALLQDAETAWAQLRGAYEASGAALAEHRRAELLVQPMSVLNSAGQRVAESDARVRAAVLKLPGHPLLSAYLPEGLSGAEEPDLAEGTLEDMLSRVSDDRAVAEAGMPLELRRRTLAASLATQEAGLLEAQAALEAASRDHEMLTLLRSQLEPEHRMLSTQAADADALAARAAEAQALVETVEKYLTCTVELAEQRRERDRQHRVFVDLKEAWLLLVQRRLDQSAAELAARLLPETGCPVCGSTEHPQPAVLEFGALVSAAEEKSAHAAQGQAEVDLRRAESKLAELEQAHAALAARGGGSDAGLARREADRLSKEAVSASQARTRVVDTQTRLDDCDARIREVLARREACRHKLVQLDASVEGLRSNLSEAHRELEDLRAGYDALTDRLRDLESLQALLAACLEADRRRAADEKTAAIALAALEEALSETAFPHAEAARRALLDRDALAEAERQCRDFEQTGHRLAAQRESDHIAAALADAASGLAVPTEADVRTAEELTNAQERALQDTRIAGEMLRSAHERLDQHELERARLLEEFNSLRERFELAHSLAETARGSGENDYRMTLTSYVLAARLEQVAVAASERLAAMTNGRYALVHSDARASHGRRSGLGLFVSDEWTGQQRDTSTLSGGESFMASLSLALGLADVVQQESGGVDIETLFVDEGFGTLDEEALEQVMDALEGLRDGGRVVGLVSHVAEMKLRIPAQLKVSRSRSGSSLTTHADVSAGYGAATWA